MLDELINQNIINTSLTLGSVLVAMGVSLLLGFVIQLVYRITNDKTPSNYFATALLLLPALMSTIILLIGNNVAGAFSLAGVFSIIRFRSSPGNAKDIIFILFCVGVGLACGVESYLLAGVFTLIISGVLLIIYLFSNSKDSMACQLKILVPEDFNQEEVFNEVIQDYASKYELQRIKTKDLGTTFELTYSLALRKTINQKEFIDKLRCRNGNLTIILSKTEDEFEF